MPRTDKLGTKDALVSGGAEFRPTPQLHQPRDCPDNERTDKSPENKIDENPALLSCAALLHPTLVLPLLAIDRGGLEECTDKNEFSEYTEIRAKTGSPSLCTSVQLAKEPRTDKIGTKDALVRSGAEFRPTP